MTRALPCSAVAIDGCRVVLRPADDGLTLRILGPNGGLRAEVFLRDGGSLAILARGFQEAAPADVIPFPRGGRGAA